MDLTISDIYALLPIIILTGTAVSVMLLIAFKRDHALSAFLTIAGLGAATYATFVSADNSLQVTPLLVFDSISRFFNILILFTSIAATIFCHAYFKHREGLQEEMYILLVCTTLGAVVMVSSNHFVSFFVGLELMGISLSALVAYPVTNLSKSSLPVEAAVKYLVMSSVSTGFLTFGMALVYASAGSMELAGIATAFESAKLSTVAVGGIAMMVAGIGFKLSLVPFHMWTSDVYQGAPAPITAFVATISKAAVLVFMLRTFITLNAYQYEAIVYAIAIIAMASMLVGNLLALMQSNVKRILAYSSIAHLGYLMVAFLAAKSTDNSDTANILAVEAVSYYTVAYVITTLTSFGIVTLLSSKDSDRDMEGIYDFQGLFWSHPFLASVFTATLLSFAGIPLTIGFIGKFYVLAAGVQSAMWTMLFVLVIGSAIGLFYYLRLIMIMVSNPDAERTSSAYHEVLGPGSETPTLGYGVLAILTIVILLLGVYPAPLIESISAMAITFR